jgi:hypothetical protein
MFSLMATPCNLQNSLNLNVVVSMLSQFFAFSCFLNVSNIHASNYILQIVASLLMLEQKTSVIFHFLSFIIKQLKINTLIYPNEILIRSYLKGVMFIFVKLATISKCDFQRIWLSFL